MFIGIMLAICVALLWSFGEVEYSKFSKKCDSANVYFYQYFARSVIYLIVALIFNIGIFGKFVWGDFFRFLPIIMCDLIGSYVINKAVKNGKLSVVSPIMAAYPIVDIILGIVLLKESIGVLELILVIVISISIILLATNEKKSKYAPHPVRGIIFASIYMLLTAFSTYFEKDAYVSNLSIYDLYYYKGIIYFITSMMFLIVVGVSKVKIKKVSWDVLKGSAITPLGNVFYSFALNYGDMMIVTPISSMYSVITNFTSRKMLKEKISFKESIFIGIIIVSTILLIILGMF